jgi:endonuclease-3
MPRTSATKKTAELRTRVALILHRLEAAYPDARVGLDFTTPLELLVATILSAQCTDERVNQITPALFKKYRTVKDYATADQTKLEEDIRSSGFFRNKAKNIRACAQALIDRHRGDVPATLEELVTLPGVGRKTANCVLSNCFDVPGITVDTHVTRIANLLGLVTTTDAVKIEFALMDIVPMEQWNTMNHLLITHGRRTCIARRPACDRCPIADLCPSAVVA